ncbi:MAG: carboxypeptidase-like regulatory domain-containing protein, partial [Terracidiphilus sp.]
MLAARIAALGLISCSLQLFAQQPQGRLTIRVTDVTGAVIPGAHIEIDHATGAPNSFQLTDSQGEFTCDLAAGSHTISIHFPGFEYWVGHIDIQSATDQRLAVTMQIGSFGGPWVVADYTDYQSMFLRLPEEPIL